MLIESFEGSVDDNVVRVLDGPIVGLLEEGALLVTDDFVLDVGPSSGVGIRLLPTEIVGKSFKSGNGGGVGGGYIYVVSIKPL